MSSVRHSHRILIPGAIYVRADVARRRRLQKHRRAYARKSSILSAVRRLDEERTPARIKPSMSKLYIHTLSYLLCSQDILRGSSQRCGRHQYIVYIANAGERSHFPTDSNKLIPRNAQKRLPNDAQCPVLSSRSVRLAVSVDTLLCMPYIVTPV